MMQRPPFKTALGIATGDVVTTSYGSGPYEVWSIYGPNLFDLHNFSGGITVRDYPVISLTLIDVGTIPRNDENRSDFRWINGIRRAGDRWISGTGDEVFVQKVAAAPIQADLFAPAEPLPEPYRFTEGVDYTLGIDRVWKCGRCLQDFNGERSGRGPAWCPVCDFPGREILVMRLADLPPMPGQAA